MRNVASTPALYSHDWAIARMQAATERLEKTATAYRALKVRGRGVTPEQGGVIFGVEKKPWRPSVKFVAGAEYPYRAFAVHTNGTKDLEGSYKNEFDALLAAASLASMHCSSNPKGKRP